MPLILLVLRLLTGIGAVFRLGASGAKWAKRRGKLVGPAIHPRYEWELAPEQPPALLRFRLKNDGQRSAIIDDMEFTLELSGAHGSQPLPLPASFARRYPIQVKPDESSRWYELELAPAVVEAVTARARLAKIRAAASTDDDTETDNDNDNDAKTPAATKPLTSGVELAIVHEHGRQTFAVPGPWAMPRQVAEPMPGDDSSAADDAVDAEFVSTDLDGLGLS